MLTVIHSDKVLTFHSQLTLDVCFRAIARAINNLVAPDHNTSDAVDVRQQLDLRIGIMSLDD